MPPLPEKAVRSQSHRNADLFIAHRGYEMARAGNLKKADLKPEKHKLRTKVIRLGSDKSVPILG
jgi:hypothetical protein